jgi:hypothetical protein
MPSSSAALQLFAAPAACIALAAEGALDGLSPAQLPERWPALAMPVLEALNYLLAAAPGRDGLAAFAGEGAPALAAALPPYGCVGFCAPLDADAAAAPERGCLKRRAVDGRAVFLFMSRRECSA